jgi:hypothetical protein
LGRWFSGLHCGSVQNWGAVSAPRSMIMIAITLYNDWPQ